MPDLDQGGIFRETTRIYQGPSLGWSQGAAPPTAVTSVTIAGTTVVTQGTSLVHVNVNGSVTIQLYRSKGNVAGAGQVPGSYLQSIVTINDVGGFAQANPITILPAVGETISGSNSFIINANYGLVSLLSDVLNGGWVAINSVSGAALTDAPNDGSAYGRQSTVWANVLPLAGGTLTGSLVLNADPAVALGASTKQYVDNTTVALSGDTMTGLLLLSADPAAALGAATKQYVDTRVTTYLPRSYLAGLGLSTAGASATFSVAAGEAMNSTNADMMVLASALSKTTGAWAVGPGNGAWDGTGTNPNANALWQHVFLIKRTDTGVVDVLISASPSAPTTPPSYTEFRRIGAMRTNASNQWLAFVQLGDEFLGVASVLDANALALNSGARTLQALTVPTGVQVDARYRVSVTGASNTVILTSPDESDQAASAAGAGVSLRTTAASDLGSSEARTRTNTSAQVGIRSSLAGNYYMSTYGWTDRRGRDA
jgi:hypothetical protein